MRESPDHLLPVGKRIGILGGGQLARFLSLSCSRLGLIPIIYCQHEDEPAAQVSAHIHVGKIDDVATLAPFFADIDVLTFENEFAPVDLIRKNIPTEVEIFPSLDIIEKIQNRASQKKLLTDHQIPTAQFEICEKKSQLETLFKKFPEGFVMKSLFGGYDGYGTWVIRSRTDLRNLKTFPKFPVLIEEVVNFKRELATLFVCAKSDEGRLKITPYPLVETKQNKFKCDWVRGPIQHPKLKTIVRKISSMLAEISYVGVLAAEFFDTGTNLLVNELAPRVHNSGHYSMNALRESQFDDHLRAGLGLPVYEAWAITPEFAMINLIGESTEPMGIPKDIRGFFHWYGKSENRPGRKMGHINFCGDQQSALLAFGLKERERIKR